MAHTHADSGAGFLQRVQGLGERYPQWWVVAAAMAAWAWMAAMPHPAAGHAHHGGHSAAAGPGALWMGVMIVAMMLPLMIGSISHVASSGRGQRRHRAAAEFVAGYLAVWMAAMLLITRAYSAAAAQVGSAAAVTTVIALAALWENTPAKHRQMRRCARRPPLADAGWRADVDCARFGAVAGAACVASCWALMAVCVAFAHSLPVMIALFGVQLGGRYQPRPSPVLSAAAIVGVCVASLAARFAG